MTDRILLKHNGRVLTITNNDPQSRNAISPEFYVGLTETLNAVADDDEVRAVIITGAGGFFCSGGNLNGLKERTEGTLEERFSSVSKLHGMIETMRNFPKPLIAAVEGGAVGAGLPLALACDLIIAARGAYVSVAYIRIGLTPDGGTTALLGPSIPRQMLSEMLMTGDRFPVERMHELGIVNALAAPGAALQEAHKLAARLIKSPPKAMANGKRLIRLSERNGFKEQLDAEAEGIAHGLGGAEAKEGVSAFLEKRQPKWD